MKKFKKWALSSKALLFVGVSSVAAASIITPILVFKSNKVENFRNINFNGRSFSSNSEIITYINANSEEIIKNDGQSVYTAKIGNDKMKFDEYKDAMDFIKSKIKSKIVYLKPGVSATDMSSLTPDNFVEKAATREVVVFQRVKYNDNDNVNENHGYTFAFLPREDDSEAKKKMFNKKINEARREAAKSYIQVHSAYKFNNIYFYTLNDLKQYLLTNKGVVFNKIVNNSKFQMIITNEGQIRFENIQSNKFKSQVSKIAVPYYKSKDTNGKTIYIKAESSNVNTIKNNLNGENLPYIGIEENEDEVTQIVDMDSATPNGNIYGNYFVKTGQSMDGVSDVKNWQPSSKDNLSTVKDMNDISILKSIISYVLKSKEFGNIIDLMNSTTLAGGGESFGDYLKKINYKDASNNDSNLFNDSSELIFEISKGVRYNSLDAISSLHSFIINKMIKNAIHSSKIIIVSKYFDSMMKVMDSFLAPLIAPFITGEKFGKDSKSFNFEYLSSAYNFYNENENGNGIIFQSNPYSYYRKLIGRDEDNKAIGGSRSVGSSSRKTIFQLLKAAMGVQAISMNALRHNQRVFSKWESDIINYKSQLKNGNYSPLRPKRPIFTKNQENKNFLDFSFDSKNTHGTSKEAISIWNNINEIDGNSKIFGINFGRNEFIDNFKNYLFKFQNKIIENYKNKIIIKIDNILEKYIDGEINNGKRSAPLEINEFYLANDFRVNTFSFIDLSGESKNVLNSKLKLNDSYNGYKHLQNMISSAVRPLKDRIKDFAVSVGTVAAQTAISVATAGVSAESMMIQREVSASKINFTKTSSGSSFKIKSGGGSKNNSSMSSWISKKTETTSLSQKTFKYKSTTIVSKGKQSKLDFFGDVDSALSSESIYDGSLAHSIIKDQLLNFSLLALMPEGVKKIVGDILDVSINIAKNIIPGLSSLMGIIDSFSSSEKKVYEFKLLEDGSEVYWDGGLVEYSWWGLHSNQKVSINDLKMLAPKEIISGYKSRGFYYGNKIYDSLDLLKYQSAAELIKQLNHSKMNNEFDKEFDNIVWGLPLAGETDDTAEKFNNINDLIDGIKRRFNSSKPSSGVIGNISQKLYKTNFGLITTTDEAYEKGVENLLKTLKKILVIKLPEISKSDSNLEISEKFSLPTPYYEKASLVKVNHKVSQDNYIILDPNIYFLSKNDDARLLELGFKQKDVDNPKTKKMLLKTILEPIKELSASKDFINIDKINNLINNYADKMYVKSKNIIFDVINQNANRMQKDISENIKTWSYEFLDSISKWTERSTKIYEIENHHGIKEYYTSRSLAIKNLKNDNNYSLSDEKLIRTSKYYNFNGFLFSSINEIYEYIIKNSKVVNND